MASKTAVLPLVTDHVRTLRDARTGRYRWQDFLTQALLPVGLAAAAAYLGARLQDAGQLVGGGAVLAGFSFGLALFVFQLRLQATEDPRIPKGHHLLELIDELFANVSYSILVGLVLVAVTVAGIAYTDAAALNVWWSLAITALALHYIATILMCLKRVRAAYRLMTI